MASTADIPELLLLLDTCAILDIVRFGSRPGTGPTHVKSVLRLLGTAGENSDTFRFGVCDVVVNEFGHNVDNVANAELSKLRDLTKRAARADEVAEALGLQRLTAMGTSPLEVDENWPERLVDKSVALARAVFDSSIKIASTDGERNKAHERVMSRIPPAKQGSSSSFDSIVTEVALRIADSRKPQATLLLTTNVQDFCDGPKIKPALAEEFTAVGLLFARSWGEAAGRLNESIATANLPPA